MDEDIAIINSNTRNQKIKDFFTNNKKFLISLLVFLILILLSFYSYQIYQDNNKIKISDKYNSVIIKIIMPEIILFLLFITKFLIFSFLVFVLIIDKSSSIIKSYSLKRIAEYLHFYNTLIHFLYQFCIKF